MKDEYTSEIAEHYAVFRPSLHPLILEQCFRDAEKFETGLDMGSGTGQSTIALSKYCSSTFGVEPSPDMINMAITHPNVKYSHYDGKRIDFPDQSFDVVTFAGSLFYAKSQELLDEVLRICMDPATIVVYDFEGLVYNLYSELGIDLEEELDYDYEVDFSGLEGNGLNKIISFNDRLTFEITCSNLAHLLLASKRVHQAFVANYGVAEPYQQLTQELENISANGLFQLSANIHCTRYGFKRSSE